jgi:Uma2 family endonuclease
MKTVPVLNLDEVQEDNPMPSRNHARVLHNLSVALSPSRDRFSVYQQLSLDLNGWQSVPDVCLYPVGTLSEDWTADQDVCLDPPALVIEVLSPKQNLQPLLDKVREYHTRGVKSCWVVIPGTGTVAVFPTTGGSRSFGDGDVVDATLDLRVPVKADFA